MFYATLLPGRYHGFLDVVNLDKFFPVFNTQRHNDLFAGHSLGVVRFVVLSVRVQNWKSVIVQLNDSFAVLYEEREVKEILHSLSEGRRVDDKTEETDELLALLCVLTEELLDTFNFVSRCFFLLVDLQKGRFQLKVNE